MNRLLGVLAAAAVLFVAAESRAQFFDDFDGDALAPHWQTVWPEPEAWDYEVSGGLLTVNSLNLPSSFGSPTNYQMLDTFIPPFFGDFTATAVMGLTAGSHRSISVQVAGSQVGGPPTILARMTFGDSGILAFGPGPVSSQPLELEPGLHEFRMIRTGSQMAYFVDELHLGSLPTSATHGAYWFRLMFDVDHPQGLPMTPILVDHVSIVPTSATGAIALALFSMANSRRRR
ncbi:MAG: hypothetical protein KF699_04095 [Phycisphaeraceae bacterium]|nr:hypothetical protein [Phycisphaeraceae bacterium]